MNNLCKCGCGLKIKEKAHHKRYGIPKYIQGHNFLCFSEDQKAKRLNNLKIANQSEERKSKISKTSIKSWKENYEYRYSKISIANKKQERRDKIRKITFDKIKKYGRWHNFSKEACLFFDKLNIDFNLDIQHALNKKEKLVYLKNCGTGKHFSLDGYSEKLKLNIEIDDLKHKKDFQIIKDKKRDNIISSILGCKILRIKKEDMTNFDFSKYLKENYASKN